MADQRGTITEQRIHGNNLRRYGLKMGDRARSGQMEGTVCGIWIITSHVASFEFDRGCEYTMISVKLDNGIEYRAPAHSWIKSYPKAEISNKSLSEMLADFLA